MKTIRYHFLPLQMSKSEYESTDWLNFTLPIVERDIANRVKTYGKAPADLCLTVEYRVTVDGVAQEPFKVTVSISTFLFLHPEYRIDHGYVYPAE